METRFNESTALFDVKTDYTWHLKFNSSYQRELLKALDAKVITFVTKHESPFASAPVAVEHNAVELDIPDARWDPELVARIFFHFTPSGYQFVPGARSGGEDSTKLRMWWEVRLGRRQVRCLSVPQDQHIEVMIVRPEQTNPLATLQRDLGDGPFWVYGNGPWLISTEPLSREHVDVLMPDE